MCITITIVVHAFLATYAYGLLTFVYLVYKNKLFTLAFDINLLATTTNMTTNNIQVPYKMQYLNSKSATFTCKGVT